MQPEELLAAVLRFIGVVRRNNTSAFHCSLQGGSDYRLIHLLSSSYYVDLFDSLPPPLPKALQKLVNNHIVHSKHLQASCCNGSISQANEQKRHMNSSRTTVLVVSDSSSTHGNVAHMPSAGLVSPAIAHPDYCGQLWDRQHIRMR